MFRRSPVRAKPGGDRQPMARALLPYSSGFALRWALSRFERLLRLVAKHLYRSAIHLRLLLEAIHACRWAVSLRWPSPMRASSQDGSPMAEERNRCVAIATPPNRLRPRPEMGSCSTYFSSFFLVSPSGSSISVAIIEQNCSLLTSTRPSS